jgi:hypothetical protein
MVSFNLTKYTFFKFNLILNTKLGQESSYFGLVIMSD